jgi:hypothetical protein
VISRRKPEEVLSPRLVDAPLHHLVVLQPRDLALQPHLRVEPRDELLRLDVHSGVLRHRALQQLLLVGAAALVFVVWADAPRVIGAAVAVVAGPGTILVALIVLVAAQGVGEEVAVVAVVEPRRVGHVRRDAGDEAEHARGRGAEPERRSLVDGVLALAVPEPVAAPLVAEEAQAVRGGAPARPEHRQAQEPPRTRPDGRLLHRRRRLLLRHPHLRCARVSIDRDSRRDTIDECRERMTDASFALLLLGSGDLLGLKRRRL